jgi:hypothetical protein
MSNTYSERGVRRVPDLLPEDYLGSEPDFGCSDD